jgi:hypothetical protein
MRDITEKTKEEDWLRELCGNDTKLYEVLARLLYRDPMAAISKEELQVLIEEAEKSDEDGNYVVATQKYTLALDKAIFEATQHGEEKDRYIKVIQDISAKASQATGKVKEKTEKTGPKEDVASLEQRINHYKLLSERTEDVVNVASLYYNEKMDKLGEQVRREQRVGDARARERETKKRESEETKEEKKDKKRQKERVEHELEEDRREKKEQETEDETRRARKEKILETRREEEKGKTGTS